MKKVLLLIIGFGLFYINIYGAETPQEQPVQEQLPQEQPQPRRFVRTRKAPTSATKKRTPTGTRRGPAAARGTRGARAVRGTRAPARKGVPTPARGRRPAPRQIARPAAEKPVSVPQVVALERPANLDVLVWNKLSEDQKKQFINLNTSFVEIVSTVSKNMNLWQRTVVESAKKLIDINPTLIDYCIAVISAELEKTAEERNVDAKTTSAFIANLLRTYQFQLIGAGKEQFNILMENIILDPATNMPLQVWVDAVTNRAKNLIDKNELTIEQVRKSITDGLKEASGQLELSSNLNEVVNIIINDITQSIKEKKAQIERAESERKELAEKERRESAPEYVYNLFQGLLLQVGNNENWNSVANKPNEAWTKNIIAAGKKMIAVFNIPLDDIEQQIGAQVYYVAATKKGGVLNAQEEKSIIDLVTFIKQQIGTA